MEAVAAIGLASSILTFVDVGWKVVHSAKQIYDSVDGVSEAAVTREVIVRSMNDLSKKLQLANASDRDPHFDGICSLARECQALCSDILSISDQIRPKDSSSRRQALKAGFKTWSKGRKLAVLEERLEACRKQLDTELLHYGNDKSMQSLEQLGVLMKKDSSKLLQVHQNVEELRRGFQVQRISGTAQDQIRKLLHMHEEALTYVYQERILKSLSFQGMNLRRDQIRNPHGHTFEWVLSDESLTNHDPQQDQKREMRKQLSREKYLTWLSSSSGIFHVSGKLGSGKSTLMRFLYSHPRTKEELEKWAGDKSLIRGNFYFWRVGSNLQKSVAGLYRSLLHDILQSCPDLIPKILPDQWSLAIQSPAQIQSRLDISATTIERALQALMKCENLYSTRRLCIFIDGLDEYVETEEYDYRALVDLLKKWVELSDGNLKLCLSSREENAFMNGFSEEERLALHHLTWYDIRDYTHELLGNIDNDTLRNKLSRIITRKANGIFLWAAWVVRAIRKEVEAEATESSLLNLLDILPVGLEQLFTYIIDSMERSQRAKFYQTMGMLQVAKLHNDRFPILAYSFFSEFLDKPDFVSRHDFCGMRIGDEDSGERRLNRAKKQLRHICGGLMETILSADRTYEEADDDDNGDDDDGENNNGETTNGDSSSEDESLSDEEVTTDEDEQDDGAEIDKDGNDSESHDGRLLDSLGDDGEETLEYTHRSVHDMLELDRFAAEMNLVLETFDAEMAFVKLRLAALRYLGDPKVRHLGDCVSLAEILLKRQDKEPCRTLLKKMDDWADRPVYEEESPGTEFCFYFERGQALVVGWRGPSARPRPKRSLDVFSTLFVAASKGYSEYVKWNLWEQSSFSSSAAAAAATYEKALFVHYMLSSGPRNHSVNPLFSRDVYNNLAQRGLLTDATRVNILPAHCRDDFKLIDGPSLSIWERWVVSEFLEWFSYLGFPPMYYTKRRKFRLGYVMEQFLSQSVNTDVCITLDNLTKLETISFEFGKVPGEVHVVTCKVICQTSRQRKVLRKRRIRNPSRDDDKWVYSLRDWIMAIRTKNVPRLLSLIDEDTGTTKLATPGSVELS